MLEHAISVSGALGGGGTIGSTEDAEPTTAPEMISGARPEDEMRGDDNGLREQNAAARKRKVADEGNFDANKEEEEDEDDDLGIAFTVLIYPVSSLKNYWMDLIPKSLIGNQKGKVNLSRNYTSSPEKPGVRGKLNQSWLRFGTILVISVSKQVRLRARADSERKL